MLSYIVLAKHRHMSETSGCYIQVFLKNVIQPIWAKVPNFQTVTKYIDCSTKCYFGWLCWALAFFASKSALDFLPCRQKIYSLPCSDA